MYETVRVRLIYSKRGGACFVPHIALAQMFSRSASRAGLSLTMTQGFSPRAKISFGPELPAGVVALNEPVDMYFQSVPYNITSLMNDALPEGFTVSRALFPPEDSPNLGKMCKSAEYLIRHTNCLSLSEHALKFWGDSVISSENIDGWLRIIVSDPAQNPIGGLIRHLKEDGIIAGWHEINAVRVAVGL
ncbi:MAG: DUF2344 domain-containing protein, partial [Synergistaceae bacterium]|nr:DUF2344 domain-containing protein [Synergistaceae bacterium]